MFPTRRITLLFIEMSVYMPDRCFSNEEQILVVRQEDSILMGGRPTLLGWFPASLLGRLLKPAQDYIDQCQ